MIEYILILSGALLLALIIVTKICNNTLFPKQYIVSNAFKKELIKKYDSHIMFKVSGFIATRIHNDWWKIYAEAWIKDKPYNNTCSFFEYNAKTKEIKGTFVREEILLKEFDEDEYP